MSRTNQFLGYFLAHRTVTLELVHKIEEKYYDYKPTPTSMSAKELVTHMVTAFYRFALTAKRGDATPFQEKIEPAESNLATLAEKYTEDTKALLASLTDEELDRVIDLSGIFGMHIPAGKLLQLAMDHEIHHKGNLFVYVREMGHTELPMFVKRG
ncbi:MAG: DinB family protein [Ectobacillus sp.]